MNRIHILALLFLAMPIQAQLVARVQLDLRSTNLLAAETALRALRPAISNYVALQSVDRQENKIAEAEVRTNELGLVVLHADYLFIGRSGADGLRDFLRTNKVAGVSGRVRFHFCPREGAIRDWAGCDRDPRAQHTEERFE